jgi:L-lactate permease
MKINSKLALSVLLGSIVALGQGSLFAKTNEQPKEVVKKAEAEVAATQDEKAVAEAAKEKAAAEAKAKEEKKAPEAAVKK